MKGCGEAIAVWTSSAEKARTIVEDFMLDASSVVK
jgi:hypothetical protein